MIRRSRRAIGVGVRIGSQTFATRSRSRSSRVNPIRNL